MPALLRALARTGMGTIVRGWGHAEHVAGVPRWEQAIGKGLRVVAGRRQPLDSEWLLGLDAGCGRRARRHPSSAFGWAKDSSSRSPWFVDDWRYIRVS